MKKRTYYLVGLLLSLLIALLSLITVSYKQNLSPDETSSFELANFPNEDFNYGSDSIYHPGNSYCLQDLVTYHDPTAEWNRMMAVHDNHRFDYCNVWKNQASDVHPPLYYSALHTVCSFSPGQYSKWQGGVVNILFAILTLWVLFSLAYELTNSQLFAIVTTSTYAILPAILNAVALFRMYTMAMFFISLLCLLFVKLQKRERPSWKQYLTIGVTTLLGALTHYYVILFTICITVTYVIIQICKRSLRNAIVLFATMVVSGAASVIAFPAMLDHALGTGVHGENAKSELFNLSGFGHRLSVYINWLDCSIVGRSTLVILALFILSLIVVVYRKIAKKPIDKPDVRWDNVMLVAVPLVCYFVIVCKTSTYIADRYMYPIYGIIILCVSFLVFFSTRILFRDKLHRVIFPLLMIAVAITSYAHAQWNNLGRFTSEQNEAIQQYKTNDCIYVHNGKWSIYQVSEHTRLFGSLTLFPQSSLDSCLAYTQTVDKPYVLIVGEAADTNFVLSKISDNIERICQYGWAITYVVNEND